MRLASLGDIADLVIIGALALAWVGLCLIPPAIVAALIVWVLS
jgi:hypothetical protein